MSSIRYPMDGNAETELNLRVGDEQCDVAPLFNSIGFLTRATHLVERDFIRSSAEGGLPYGTYSALAMIGRNPGIRQGLLGKVLQVQQSNMANLTKRLLAKKLVDRRPLGNGRRGIGLWLTASGSEQVETLTPVMRDLDRKFAAALEPHELATLARLLARVLQSHI